MANPEKLPDRGVKENITEISSNPQNATANNRYRGLPTIAAVLLLFVAFMVGALTRGFDVKIKSVNYVTTTGEQGDPVYTDGNGENTNFENEPPMSTSPGAGSANGANSDAGASTTRPQNNNNIAPTNASSNNAVPTIKSNSTADIISYFNTAVNNMKAARPGLTKIESATPSNIEISSLPNWLSGLQDYIVDTFITSKNTEVTLKKGEDNIEVVSVYKEQWASKLTAEDILNCSYTTTSDGKHYEIKISIKPEVNPGDRGKSAHGRVFSIITPDYILEQSDSASFLGLKADIKKENVTLSYEGSNILCRVEKSTGRVVYMKTEVKSDSDIKGVKVGFITTDFFGTVLSEIIFKDFVY